MKRNLLLLIILLVTPWVTFGQKSEPKLEGYLAPDGSFISLEMAGGAPETLIAKYLQMFASAPTCSRKGQLYYDTVLNKQRVCTATPSTWETVASGASVGTVTSVDASGGVQTTTGSAITTTGTIRGVQLVDARTTATEALLDATRGKFVTFSNAGATAVSIAQAGTAGNFPAGWWTEVRNLGVGTVTITPATSTIGGAATLVLTTGQSAKIQSDATNYLVSRLDISTAQRTVLGNTSGTNTGDQTLPVKASGAELATGTDDAKFATAKAIKDSHNVPSVAPGTSGNVLTSNGTDWTSAAASGGTSKAVLAVNGGGASIATIGGQVFTAPFDADLSVGSPANDETQIAFIVPYAGTIKNLFIMTAGSGALGGTTVTVTVRKNAADTALTATMAAISTTASSDTTHSFSVAQGDRITISLTPVGGTGSATIASMSMELDSP